MKAAPADKSESICGVCYNYVVKTCITVVFFFVLFFRISALKHRLLLLARTATAEHSNEYQPSMFRAEIRKNIHLFKIRTVLHRRVRVMINDLTEKRIEETCIRVYNRAA